MPRLEIIDELALASLKWLLINDAALGDAIRSLADVGDEEEEFDGTPLRTLMRHITSEMNPVEASKAAFQGRAAFWSYESEDGPHMGPHMSVEELHAYEGQLRKELEWTRDEKKRRIVALSSPKDEGDAPAESERHIAHPTPEIHRTYTQPGEKLQTLEQVKDFVRMTSPKSATPIQRAEAWSELCELLGIEW